ncbi:MAG TPA: GNAT family N-acetyltransferase [Actinomycetales bacterium]|nr:GNAT family N-acetyltransferase [Actinomycetales bacterium]
MADVADLLAAYDEQLRDVAEVLSADHWERHGPLIWALYPSGRGFVTYRTLDGYAGSRLDELVAETVEHYSGTPDVSEFEWKTRGHDDVPELDAVLRRHGLEPDDVESVMIGRAEDLAVDVPLPTGVTLRRVTAPDDVRRMVAMQDEVFGDPHPGMADELVQRLAERDDGMEMWVAEADGEIVSAGRVEPVEGTDFAGIWGGATRPQWRGRGIYRALTAERARSALRRGVTYINSDSTEYSRPILERSGFLKVTTTTPYEWRRP